MKMHYTYGIRARIKSQSKELPPARKKTSLPRRRPRLTSNSSEEQRGLEKLVTAALTAQQQNTSLRPDTGEMQSSTSRPEELPRMTKGKKTEENTLHNARQEAGKPHRRRYTQDPRLRKNPASVATSSGYLYKRDMLAIRS